MKQPVKDPFAAKPDQKAQIAKAIELKMGRPAANATEGRKRAALTSLLAGDKPSDVERVFGVAQTELTQYFKTVFPTDDDRFKFLEDCLLTNATLASSQFVKKYGELDAEGAARAMGIFAGKALEVKKARQAGFQEAPINVGVILSLQKTLDNLATPVKEI